jgi:hypothetical protein
MEFSFCPRTNGFGAVEWVGLIKMENGAERFVHRKWMGKVSPLPRAQPPAFGLYGLRAGNRLLFAEPGMAKALGYCIEKSCLPPCLAFEEASTASVLPLGCRFAGKERRHFSGTDFFVTGLDAFVIEEPFRTATAFPDGFEQVAPGSQAMIGRIKHPPANERTAHQPKKIGTLDDKGFDLDCHLATSS